MIIGGLQKTSLVDYPDNIACSIFLSGCNFRCGFCHNPELVLGKRESKYSEKEILDFLEKRKKYLDGVCITGGEPLINSDLPDFLEKIKKLNYKIKIDTNGSNPDLLKKIIEKKLADYIALDVKAEKENYGVVTGSKIDIKKIEESIKITVESGLDYEIRTTVIRGVNNLEEIGKWINSLVKKPKKYVIQNFVSKNELVDKRFNKVKVFTEGELEEMKSSILNYFEDVKIRS